jgi:hypothetical protein
MARQKRTLAGFDEVANTNINVNTNNNVNDDVIGDILGDKKEKVLVGIYFDPEVAAVLDRVTKGGKRGAKSALVNEALKRILIEKGLL